MPASVAVVYSDIPLGFLHLSPILDTRKGKGIPWGRGGRAVAQANTSEVDLSQ